MDEIKKSIAVTLYERTTSPLFGTFIISWILWNWKIIYLTIFVSENKISGTKIEYIVSNYCDVNLLITYPIISTVLLITVIPFFSNGAYWLTLKFSNWRLEQKNSIERNQLLTVEQSIELREQILKQEERFTILVSDKNFEIERLSNALKDYEKNNPNFVIDREEGELIELSDRIKGNEADFKVFRSITTSIQSSRSISITPEISKILVLLESYNIIDKSNSSLYKFTERGKRFLRHTTSQ